eukprot:CAMPEP_0114552532 /NCGR_PEP_ID=MMETSP0114-20121206/7173_1 /TAXON_ID=31324 /ORGANISM="Goniomonas sp, Strain m" /LENGTH=433 /DNA_ID=CAMNT_0001737411 /DNA_START=15 /DNA_END=1316 /DNA_ORIENTATION=-
MKAVFIAALGLLCLAALTHAEESFDSENEQPVMEFLESTDVEDVSEDLESEPKEYSPVGKAIMRGKGGILTYKSETDCMKAHKECQQQTLYSGDQNAGIPKAIFQLLENKAANARFEAKPRASMSVSAYKDIIRRCIGGQDRVEAAERHARGQKVANLQEDSDILGDLAVDLETFEDVCWEQYNCFMKAVHFSSFITAYVPKDIAEAAEKMARASGRQARERRERRKGGRRQGGRRNGRNQKKEAQKQEKSDEDVPPVAPEWLMANRVRQPLEPSGNDEVDAVNRYVRKVVDKVVPNAVYKALSEAIKGPIEKAVTQQGLPIVNDAVDREYHRSAWEQQQYFKKVADKAGPALEKQRKWIIHGVKPKEAEEEEDLEVVTELQVAPPTPADLQTRTDIAMGDVLFTETTRCLKQCESNGRVDLDKTATCISDHL